MHNRVAQMLCNRHPTKTANGYMTPYEFINGSPPNMEHFRVWGCKCCIREPRSDIRKDWSDRSRVEALLGWMVYIPELDKMVISVHICFIQLVDFKLLN